MSLKAKIEAVIYASEEPVTLAQLTGLLGLEGQAELDALIEQQASLALNVEQVAESAANTADEPADDEADNDEPDDDEALNEEVLEPSVILNDVQAPTAQDATAAADDAASAEPTAGPAAELDAKAVVAEARARDAAAKLKERRLREYFRSLLDSLIADYANGDRGLEIREVAGGFRLATKPEFHDAVRGFVKSLKPPLKLTLQALETLAVVAYKQPVTAPEVAEIRGVESAGTLGSLMTRKLVTTAGRKQVIGRPILYKTTKDFLLRFGLKDINELPSIEEFEKMAGELNGEFGEAVQEEIPMDSPEAEDFKAPSPDGTSAAIAETDSAPEPTHMHHDTPEDLMSDRSTSPEGHRLETAHPGPAHPGQADSGPADSSGIHTPQADGTPEDEA